MVLGSIYSIVLLCIVHRNIGIIEHYFLMTVLVQ